MSEYEQSLHWIRKLNYFSIQPQSFRLRESHFSSNLELTGWEKSQRRYAKKNKKLHRISSESLLFQSVIWLIRDPFQHSISLCVIHDDDSCLRRRWKMFLNIHNNKCRSHWNVLSNSIGEIYLKNYKRFIGTRRPPLMMEGEEERFNKLLCNFTSSFDRVSTWKNDKHEKS